MMQKNIDRNRGALKVQKVNGINDFRRMLGMLVHRKSKMIDARLVLSTSLPNNERIEKLNLEARRSRDAAIVRLNIVR